MNWESLETALCSQLSIFQLLISRNISVKWRALFCNRTSLKFVSFILATNVTKDLNTRNWLTCIRVPSTRQENLFKEKIEKRRCYAWWFFMSFWKQEKKTGKQYWGVSHPYWCQTFHGTPTWTHTRRLQGADSKCSPKDLCPVWHESRFIKCHWVTMRSMWKCIEHACRRETKERGDSPLQEKQSWKHTAKQCSHQTEL